MLDPTPLAYDHPWEHFGWDGSPWREVSPWGSTPLSKLHTEALPDQSRNLSLWEGMDFMLGAHLTEANHKLLKKSVLLWWGVESFQRMGSQKDAGRGNRSL